MILRIFEVTKDFPRDYRYTLGQDMKRNALQLVRCIYRANRSRDRVEPLEQFLDQFDLLKLEVRLCVDMRLLPIRRQAELAELMEGNGKQITGWRKASR